MTGSTRSDRPASIAAVVVTHESSSVIGRCLTSLSNAAPRRGIAITVVDNASTDGTKHMASGIPAVGRLIALDTNRGFAAGVNAGLRDAVQPWLAIVNPDVEFPAGALDRLADVLEARAGAGLVGPRVRLPCGRIEATAGYFPTLARERIHAHFLDRLAGRAGRGRSFPTQTQPVDWVSGCAWLLRGDAYRAIGPLDEGYFMYVEDVDYCRRLCDAGWDILATPEVEVLHLRGQGSRDSKQLPADGGPSLVRYFEKFRPDEADALRVVLARGWLLRRTIHSVRARLGSAGATVLARRYALAVEEIGRPRLPAPGVPDGASLRGRIAYDLRYACDHFPGIGTHAYQLLVSMLELESDDRFLVLWNPQLKNTRFDFKWIRNHPRVLWVERPYSPLSLGGLVRTGRWLRGSQASVYLSPFHLPPIGAGLPRVVTVHDVRPMRRAGGLSWWKRRLFHLSLLGAARARTIIAISDFSRAEIQRVLALRDGQVQTVRHGIRARPRLDEERRPEGAPDGDFALVVGDNRPHKNLALLADVWARLESRAPLHLISVGPMDRRYPDLGTLASRVGARGVSSLGWLSAPELEWLYRRARILLVPSLYEGFGAPMVEAFAHGVPVLASDIPVLREIGGEVPNFLNPNRPDDWAAEILSLLGDPKRQERMRSAGLACAGMPSYRETAEATLEIVRAAARGA